MKHTLRILIAVLGMPLVMFTPTVAASEEEAVSNAYLYLGEVMDK